MCLGGSLKSTESVWKGEKEGSSCEEGVPDLPDSEGDTENNMGSQESGLFPETLLLKQCPLSCLTPGLVLRTGMK